MAAAVKEETKPIKITPNHYPPVHTPALAGCSNHLPAPTCRSETYSSTVPSVDGADPTFVDPLGSQIRSPRDGRGAGTHQGDGSRLRGNTEKKASAAGNIAHTASRRRQSQSSKTLANSERRSSRTRYEYEDIPKSDWGRTLDTTVSIPEGPEERADEHEANASLEMMDSSIQIMTSRGKRT